MSLLPLFVGEWFVALVCPQRVAAVRILTFFGGVAASFALGVVYTVFSTPCPFGVVFPVVVPVVDSHLVDRVVYRAVLKTFVPSLLFALFDFGLLYRNVGQVHFWKPLGGVAILLDDAQESFFKTFVHSLC